MSQDWADNVAQKLIRENLIQAGTCLILGAADTGKTTLAAALARRLVPTRPVGIVDADIGQSHIGPPTTVGWAVAANPLPADLWQLPAAGISFVGDVTPVGHLLQLTAAITQCVRQASKAAELIIVDTPGFISGTVASALWWTVQHVLNPTLILAVQRENELSDILAGLPPIESFGGRHRFNSHLELVKCSSQIRTKSPEERRSYRQEQFNKYFCGSLLHNINLSNIAVQATQNLSCNSPVSRIAALRNRDGVDVAIGIIKDWQVDKNIAVIRAPQLDMREIRCLVIGDATVDFSDS
jgi:polynucleotide 5'-hydroxyl-kinase GRC3/NOL9